MINRETRAVMKDEISQLFGYLEMLIGSCADHDIITDIFVSQSDPRRYREALDGINECTRRIVASGLTREQLNQLFMELGGDSSPELEGLVEPRDLIPLIGTAFSPVQEELIRDACREWGKAMTPGDPDSTAMLIRSAIHPLALTELLSPEATGMLRFPTILQLQTAGKRNIDLVRPPWDMGTRILVPATDDLAIFSGQLYVAIFWSLSGKGRIKASFFPETVIQALYDAGVLLEGGIEALGHSFRDDEPLIMELFETGRELARDFESVTDIRTLFRLVLEKFTGTSRSGGDLMSTDGSKPPSFHQVRQCSGHVLAGFVATREGVTSQTCLSQVLDFIDSVAARPSGRACPGPGQLRELERNVQELEQLIRAVTGHYAWRAMQMTPDTGGYRPVADLLSGRKLILYDQEEMANRSAEASKALVMEALYREWFGLRPSDYDTKTDTDEWYSRLVSVLGGARAVRKGVLVHPGVARWLNRLYQEEYSLVNRIANRSRVACQSLPDQFLEAAVFEGRTGEQAVDISDVLVKQALEMTYGARREIRDPQITDEMCMEIINGADMAGLHADSVTILRHIAKERGFQPAGSAGKHTRE